MTVRRGATRQSRRARARRRFGRSGRRRGSRLAAARFGVAVALLAPLAWFAGSWLAHGGSASGLAVALASGALQAVVDLLAYALAHPLSVIVYLIVISLVTRFAIGARR